MSVYLYLTRIIDSTVNKMSSKKAEETSGLSNSKKPLSSGKFHLNSKLGNCEDEDSVFKGILKKKFKVFRVSPMYNFSCNKLEFYQNKLNEDLNSRKRQNSNVYKSRFILNSNLRLSSHSLRALQVEIIKNDSQSTYVGHFISWSNTRSDSEGSVSLPILLVEAKAHGINSVHSILCKIFDCDIQPLTFSFHAIISFFVKLLEAPRNDIDIAEEQVTLEYKIPGCEANDKIKLSLFIEATIIIFAVTMDSLQEKFQGITSMEIILEFYNKVLNHAYKIFKIDLALAELQKVSFPDAFLTSDGQIKMNTPGAVLSTLEVLNLFVPLDAILSS